MIIIQLLSRRLPLYTQRNLKNAKFTPSCPVEVAMWSARTLKFIVCCSCHGLRPWCGRHRSCERWWMPRLEPSELKIIEMFCWPKEEPTKIWQIFSMYHNMCIFVTLVAFERCPFALHAWEPPVWRASRFVSQQQSQSLEL